MVRSMRREVAAQHNSSVVLVSTNITLRQRMSTVPSHRSPIPPCVLRESLPIAMCHEQSWKLSWWGQVVGLLLELWSMEVSNDGELLANMYNGKKSEWREEDDGEKSSRR